MISRAPKSRDLLGCEQNFVPILWWFLSNTVSQIMNLLARYRKGTISSHLQDVWFYAGPAKLVVFCRCAEATWIMMRLCCCHFRLHSRVLTGVNIEKCTLQISGATVMASSADDVVGLAFSLNPQAGAVSRIRRRIFVRWKSAERVRLVEYYSRRKIPLHYYCISMLDSGERLNWGTGHVTPLFKTSKFQYALWYFCLWKILSRRPSAVFTKKYRQSAEFQPYFYL